MRDDVKLRLYVTAIVIVMAILYVGPLIVNSHFASVLQELLSSCSKEWPGLGFDFCWQDANQKAALPLWEYLLPYLPAVALLWLNWLIKPTLRLSDESYPRRTMNVLLWLGLLVAALGIWFSIMSVVELRDAELHKLSAREILTLPWTAAGWLIAPLLFHHLVAPVSLAASIRKGEIALLLLAAAPIVAGVLFLVREVIRNMGG